MSSPGVIGDPSVYVKQIIIGISYGLAVLTTAFRLTYRYRTRRLWWDDLWAAVALTTGIFVCILHFTLARELRERLALGVQIFRRLGIIIGYTSSLWSARISIGVTIVRLVTPGSFRTICKCAIYLFTAFFVILSVQKVFMCGTRWKEIPHCPIPRGTAYQELTTDLLADAWLICAPAYMLCRMKLSNQHRRLLIAIFSCSIFITFSSIAHSYFIVVRQTLWVGITGHIQLGVSIVVCNLLVLVTFLYRIFCQYQDENKCAEPSSGYSTTGRTPPNNIVSALSMDLAIRTSPHTTTDAAPGVSSPTSHLTYESRSCLRSSDFQLSFTDVATSAGSYPLGSDSERDASGVSRPDLNSKSTS